MIDPNIGGCLNANAISVCRENILADDVANDNVSLLPDVKSNANEFYTRVRSLFRNELESHLLAPGSPIMDLLEPILTCTSPVIVPEMMTVK